MKIVYIGTGDALAQALAERMGQEGNDIYLLSDKALPKKPKGVSLHRFYRSPRKGENFGKLLRSIAPDCVIFAGNDYISGAHVEESDEDVTLLARSLRAAAAFPRVKFILLSSERVKVKGRNKKKWAIPADIRQMAENLVLFEAFFLLSSLCGSHSLFSQIDWLMVYVILIAISYNIYQSALAAVLASAAYLYSQNLSILEMTTFHSYAGTVQTFMQYVSLGLIVSYTTNTLKQDAWSVRLDLDMLKEEYDDLKAVNEENVLIKNEYEERLLTSKTGFPKLYDLISRLMVQEPERILMETMQVISELVRTDTVAVYQGQAGSPWLRLAGALNDSSVMEGKSWNLSNFPKIYTAVAQGELYQGELGSGEPAVVLPIVCRDIPAAVVLIKTLPYECETLYHVNLLKTMSLLLRDSMEKALQYEELSRSERYVEGTDVMRPEAFRKQVRLAQEKAEKSMAEYCVVELAYSGPLRETAAAVSRALRVADRLGTDEKGALFALLNNTGPESLAYLQERLLACGVEARPVADKPEAALSASATV